jgi:phytoene dehydrogenase-like protein
MKATVNIRTTYDAVIVGGGHNGLVAAAYLARAGLAVLVLERNVEVGGATASARLFAGMDARVSRYAYLVSLLPQTIVDDLQIRFVTRRRRIASCTPCMDGGAAGALLLSNVDAAASEASFRAIAGDADWRGYQALLALEQKLAQLVWPSLLAPLRSRRSWKSALRSPAERAAWEAFVDRPLGEALEHYVQSDLVRGLVFTDAKIGISAEARDDSLLQNRCFILHTIGNGTGEWQVPVGGMGMLASALAESARLGGAELVTGAHAVAIDRGGPEHTVIFQAEGRDYAAGATRVLVNAGPHVFARLLGLRYTPTPADEGSVCKVNMLLRRLPRLLAQIDPRDAFAGTLHIDESYTQMQASYRQAMAGELPECPPFEMYCHTLTDDTILSPALREAGYHTLTLFGLDVPYRLFEQDNEATKAEMLRRYLRGLNRILLDPIEECLAMDANGQPCIEIRTPVDLARELTLNRGNIFHGALSWFFCENEDEEGTWGVETPYQRIYRCGASALRGGAVSGIPGRNAAQRIFDELHISRR